MRQFGPCGSGLNASGCSGKKDLVSATGNTNRRTLASSTRMAPASAHTPREPEPCYCKGWRRRAGEWAKTLAQRGMWHLDRDSGRAPLLAVASSMFPCRLVACRPRVQKNRRTPRYSLRVQLCSFRPSLLLAFLESFPKRKTKGHMLCTSSSSLEHVCCPAAGVSAGFSRRAPQQQTVCCWQARAKPRLSTALMRKEIRDLRSAPLHCVLFRLGDLPVDKAGEVARVSWSCLLLFPRDEPGWSFVLCLIFFFFFPSVVCRHVPKTVR